jgi:RNA polymerase-binding transcription factor DksA
MAEVPWRLQREVTTALKAERGRLQRELGRLDEAERELGASQRDEGGPGGATADVASDLTEEELALALALATSERLTEVDLALLRLAEGVYGDCLLCGHRIGRERLRALPWTAYCRDCAGRLGARQPPTPAPAGLVAHMH